MLAVYVGHGRRTVAVRKRAAGGRGEAAVTAAEIREWARENGCEVPDRGRVPSDVRDAYEAAH